MSNTITLKYMTDNIIATSDAPKTLALGELAVSGLNANNASTDAVANYLTLWIGLDENTAPLPLSGWHRENNARTLMALTPIGATFIDSDSDLNDIKFLRVGTYHCYYDSRATSIVNKPPTLTQSFMMRVYSPIYKSIDDEIESPNNDVYRVREIITRTGVEYIQYVHKSGDVWTFGGWDLKYTSGNLIGAVSTIATSDLTANRALISNADGKVAVSAVTATKLSYLNDVTSAIQAQLNGKLSITGTAAKATADKNGRDFTRFYENLIPAVSATAIPTNTNINSIEYLKVGSYKCSSNNTAETLVNIPEEKAFVMSVISPISVSYDNEATSTYVYRIRKLLTHQGHEYKQYINSGSVAGEFEYGEWETEYTSGNLKNASEIIELQQDIQDLSNSISNQITYGMENGWSYALLPGNMVILRKNTSVKNVAITTANGGVYYSDSISDYLPTSFKVYDATVSINAEGSVVWSTNAGVSADGTYLYYRAVRGASTTLSSLAVNYLVFGSTVPVEYPTVPETSGTAIADFKIWSSPSRNMKVTYVATRTSDTTASITLTYTYTMNTSAGTTGYAQYVTPTINNVTQSRLTLKSTSNSSNWYNDPIIKNATYTISNLSASTTSITLSCKFEDTDSDTGIGTNPLTKTGTINLAKYS